MHALLASNSIDSEYYPTLARLLFTVGKELQDESGVRLSPGAKKVIACVGCNPVVNAKEEIDRATIAMIPAQERLVEAVYGVNPNTAVALITNYPYAINWMQAHVPAIVTTASGSQDLGSGLAAVLLGDAAPAGRLPMT